mmetsp:Transcript_19833/g.39701  ORF Transcript_19833/g.39701 Transcript_19833/m.39701 type:complete len:736 (+) Transcript_19833:36-2243(+)
MDHNNSQDHPIHPVDTGGAAEKHSWRSNNAQEGVSQSLTQYAAVNHYGQHIQPHPYNVPTHHAGGNQLQHHQQPNQNHLHHHHYYNSNHQTTSWQWMPVAIPPPPPPPPPHNPHPPHPSTGSTSSPQGESQISNAQTKRRKRRWGPGVNEQQTVSEQQTKKAAAAKDSSTSTTEPEPKLMKEENNSTDGAIDAINALSTLESRWKVPQKKKKTRRKRKRKKGNNTSNCAQINIDADKMHNVWIDVEDVVKIINPSGSVKQEKIEDSGKTLDGANAKDFPPLKSETKEEEEKTKSTSTGDSERDLNAMDTSDLKSYADVLSKALGRGSKNPSSNEDDSEMDISEEEEEESSDDTPGPETVDRSSPDDIVSEETATDQSAAAKDKADEEDAKREKEKRALKLAELKAKAKLANAKLRMALQRKAMGNTPKDAKASVAGTASGRSTPTYNAATHQTKRPWHTPASNVSALRDISALRNINKLIIPEVSRTGPDEMVRFIDSVYDLSSSEDYELSDDEGEEEDKDISAGPPEAEALPNNESQKKSHQSLKQQLQLAKLRLEIKRKEQVLLEKKRKMPVVAVAATDSKLPSVPSTTDLTINASKDDCNDSSGGKAKLIDNASDVMISSEEKREKLEQLRRRQKELKQKNEVSNLKNLINRQRHLLRTQGQELTESSTQLESVVSDIVSKQTLLNESNKRLEELNHRKKIMEGMMLRATEKLMTARKALGQHKQRNVTTTD